MKNFTLQREALDSNADAPTFGVFSDDAGGFTCQTAEPRYPMPAGKYRVRLRYSPSHGYCVPGWLNVPGHSDIEMHSGNTIADTKNCVLPGEGRSESVEGSDHIKRPGVTSSRDCFKRFMTFIGCPGYRDLRDWDAVREFNQANPDVAEFTVEVLDA